MAEDGSLPEFGRSVLLERDGDAVHALAGADPEVAVGVEEHGQRIVVPDAVGESDTYEFPDEGVVAPCAAILCQDEDFAARAACDLVHSLKLGVPFDALVCRVEEVESVVGADPEERIARDGDLFDQFVLVHGYPLSVVTPCGQSKKNLEHYSLKKAQHQAKLPEKPRKLRQC